MFIKEGQGFFTAEYEKGRAECPVDEPLDPVAQGIHTCSDVSSNGFILTVPPAVVRPAPSASSLAPRGVCFYQTVPGVVPGSHVTTHLHPLTAT